MSVWVCIVDCKIVGCVKLCSLVNIKYNKVLKTYSNSFIIMGTKLKIKLGISLNLEKVEIEKIVAEKTLPS